MNADSDQIGPTVYRVSRAEKRCGGCKYHFLEMIHSGRNPLYEHACLSPEAHDRDMLNRRRNGRHIGDDDITPEWCPVEKINQK